MDYVTLTAAGLVLFICQINRLSLLVSVTATKFELRAT